MSILTIIIGVILLIIGILVNTKLGDYMIAGLNTASEEEKESFNIKKVKTNISFIVLAGSLPIILYGFLPNFKETTFAIIMIIYALLVTVDILIINISSIYKKK